MKPTYADFTAQAQATLLAVLRGRAGQEVYVSPLMLARIAGHEREVPTYGLLQVLRGQGYQITPAGVNYWRMEV